MKRIKLRNLGRLVAPLHNFDPKWIKKGLAPSKNPAEWPTYMCFASIKIKPFFLKQYLIFYKFNIYIFIINMHVCNTTNSSLKYKKKRIRRRKD